MLVLVLAAFAATPTVRTSDTWDFSAVYPSVEAWEAAVGSTEKEVDALEGCKGKVATNLRSCLDQRFNVQKTVNRIYTYASNLSNQDTRDATWMARSQRAEALYTRYMEKTAYYGPEIIAMGPTVVEVAIAGDPGLKPYDHYLRATAKDAAHTLTADNEAILASLGSLTAAPERIHSVVIDAELPWPTVKLSDGTELRLDPTTYGSNRDRPVRADRKLVFDSFYTAMKGFQGTLGSTLDTVVQGHWLIARTRHYPTSVAASIDANHLPPEIYQTLVSQTNKNLPTLHRYLKLRAKMLGISDLAYYDMYPPLVAADKHWTIDEAEALTLSATAPLGKEYTSVIKSGFEGRWMDVYPHEGKRGGAYMDGAAYDVHPFVLMNYTGDYDAVSTLAHEWGHAMHSVLSARNQPYAKADYSTFIAEIASTFNEALLLESMLKASKTDDEKLFYLGNALESLRTTYYRQAQFAEFELAIHTQVEKGEPLTGESLSATYLDILKRYYGAEQGVTKIDDLYGLEWAYVPHFYYNFYVYQYATSIAASSLLAEDVLAKKPGALDRYMTLLKAGGSDEPYTLLKNAGVDMATPAPYDAIAKRMDAIMDQMEAILAKKAKGKK